MKTFRYIVQTKRGIHPLAGFSWREHAEQYIAWIKAHTDDRTELIVVDQGEEVADFLLAGVHP